VCVCVRERERERERESCYNILFVFSLEWIFNRIVVNAILVCVCVFFFLCPLYIFYSSLCG
jgi:hypothetical protein